MKITACLLFYGSYVALAKRAVDTFLAELDHRAVREIRCALAHVVPETRNYLYTQLAASPWPVRVLETQENPGKYPLMRRLFGFGTTDALTTELVCWADDDVAYELDWRKRWQQVVAAFEQDPRLVQVGSVKQTHEGYAAPVSMLRKQPWYRGRPAYDQPPWQGCPTMRFVTGGWWTARTDFLQRWNYPFPDLHHNGGDTILGHLIRQQDRGFIDLHPGVIVNGHTQANSRGAPRRGMTTVGYLREPPKVQPTFQAHWTDLSGSSFSDSSVA